MDNRACAIFYFLFFSKAWTPSALVTGNRPQDSGRTDGRKRMTLTDDVEEWGFLFFFLFVCLTMFKGGSRLFNTSCGLLAQNIAGPPVWTVEEKSGVGWGGHDVDSTAYLQYIQNKALFSADKLECSAALCLTIWTIIQQYEGLFHQKRTKKNACSLLKLLTHTHAHTHTHHLFWLSWLFERLGCFIPS